MKLIGYEFYKISKKRIVLLLSFFLLVINGVFYVYEQYKTNETLIQDLQAYKQQEQKYEGISPEEGWQLTSAQYEQLNLFQQFVQADVFSDDPVWQSFMEELIKEQEDAYQQYLESPYYNHADAIRRDAFINERLKSQFEHALHFQEKIMTMEDRAKDMVSVSIFNDKHSFSYRNIVKTVEDFKPLRGLPFQLGLEEGVVTGTNFRPTDLFTPCIGVVLCRKGGRACPSYSRCSSWKASHIWSKVYCTHDLHNWSIFALLWVYSVSGRANLWVWRSLAVYPIDERLRSCC